MSENGSNMILFMQTTRTGLKTAILSRHRPQAVLGSRSNFDRLQFWRPAPVPAPVPVPAPGNENLLHKFKEKNSVLKNKRRYR